MHCKDGRALELSVVVNVPSGLLSNYTKIVQFLPRFLVVNNLPYPIRLWQDSSIFRPHSYNQGDFLERFSRWRFPTRDNEADHSNKVNQYEGLWGRETVLDERELGKMRIETAADKSALYITTVFPTEIIPFILPDSRGDRQIRMDVGLPWALTSSFSTDIAGDHILKIKEATDMRLLSHVSTRSNPVYDVVLPESGDTSFDGELGIWFETEWVTGRSLIVTAVKKNSYSFTETDIQVGDELFAIDDIPTSRLTFIDAMQLLRIKLLGVASKQPPSALLNKATAAHLSTKGSNPSNDAHTGIVVLKFRTMEERLRMVRMKAVDGGTEKQRSLSSTRFDEIDLPNSRGSDLFDIHEKDRYVQAELKTLPQSFVGMILVLRDEPSVPFAIENRSCKYTLFYRQKGCHHLAWLSLKPSRSNRYSWDEPLKPKRLIVRVGLSKIDYVDSNKGLTWQAHRNVDDGNKRKGGKVEEDARFSNSIGIPLEEIGFCDFLSVSKKDNAIVASHLIKLHVDVVGGLRVLMINDVSERKDEEDLSLYVESIGRKVAIESDRMEKLRILRLSLDQSPFINDNIRIFSATEELMGTFPDETRVTKCHQLFVEVLEAVGLCPGTVDGACNPYAEVSLQTGVHDRKIIFKRTDVRQTYHVRKSIDPSWIAQSFVFDVPQDAVLEARGYSVNVRLRSFRRFRKHTSLGRAIVDLQNVRSQGFVEGWFPLSSRGGRLELENRRSLWGRGSIRLRIRWIHSEIALVEYFTELSERRQQELKEDLEVATQQVVKLREEEEEKNARMDTFRAVRVQEYQLSPRINLMTRSALAERVKLTKSAIIRLVDPLRPRLVQSFVSTKNFRSKETMVIESDPARMLTFAIPEKTEAAKKRFHASTESTKTLVDRLLLQRKMIRCVSRIWTQKLIRTSTSGNVTVTVSSLKSWSAVRAIFNDDQIESEINDFYIKIMLRGEKAILDSEKSLHMRGLSPIEEKLCSPLSVPYVKRIETDSYAANFIQSRRQFDRIACVSLNTILHSGGWLTIRPMTARNLPDPFTGMVVRAKFGGQSLTTESVDSKFLDPSWFLPDPLVDLEEQWNVICPNDLSIRVSAQTTSGSIRLSVLGERSQQLNSRIELGMLQLPIGLAIAACMDCMESKKRNSSVPLMYVRWFPLTNPKGAVHVDENDEGRSKESEKLSSDLFHNHFAPCIQLGIVWTPTTDDRNGVTLLEEATLPRPENLPPTIRSYVKVDVSQISVALIDSHRTCELISLTIQDIDVCYWITQAKTRMSVICGWIQVDYQDEHAREPVVLAPTPVDIVGPVLQTLALKSNAQSDSDVVSFDFIDISLAEFDLTIEERLLLDLVAFVDFISRRKTANLQVKTAIDDAYQQKYLNPFSTVNFPPLFEVLKPESDSETEQPGKIYIKQLLLGSIKVNLSYLKGKSRDVVWTDSKVDGILGIGDGKSALEHIFHSGDIPNIPLAWSQHTFDDDLRVNGTGKAYPLLIASNCE